MRARLIVERRRMRGERPLANARVAWSEREHLLVTLTDVEGRQGIGEAAPLEGHSHETIEAVESELSSFGLDLPAQVPDDVVAWLGASSRPLRHPSSRFALETALLDWAGHVSRRPAALLLGTVTEDLPLAAVIDGAPSSWRAGILEATARGYGTLKLKVSPATLGSAIELVSEIRRDLPSIRWRLDANRSLPPALLAALRDRADRFELIEEPCDSDVAIEDLPVALDESLVRPEWETVVRRQGARFVVLKPMALGGIAATLDRAARARALGLRVVVSYLWEGPVGWAASIAVALAAGDRALAQGLAPHAQLEAWPPFVVESVAGPVVRATTAPGLGLRWSSRP